MLDPLAVLFAGSLLVPVADGKAKGCNGHKPFKTQIEVRLDIPDIRYNFKLPREKLTENQIDLTTKWKSEHEDHVWASHDLTVEGLARGGVGVMTASQFVGVPYDRYGIYYCPYVKKLIVDVHYNTQIFVASQYKQGTCDFNAVLEHEHKHHATNVQAVNEIMAKLKEDLPGIIAYMEKRYVGRQEMGKGFGSLSEGLDDALKIYSEYMFKEMTKRNALIDTPEEYERVDGLCPETVE